MIVRELTAADIDGRERRIAERLSAAAAARVVAAADVRVLVDDDAGSAADGLARLLRAHGAAAEPGSDGELVVAATRAQLADALAASDGAAAVALQRFIDAFARIEAACAGVLRLRERALPIAAAAHVMGIVNVTPDSFYDRAAGLADVVARTEAIVAAGGAIVDVGGQSYAHWNAPVTPEEERARVVPAVEAIRAAEIDVAISIDTFTASVAAAALGAGAHVINDCSGLSDPELAEVVAGHGAAVVVMHLKGELNRRDPAGYRYGDALREIVSFLYERTERALAAGVRRDAIVVDPGLEFGKEPQTDLEILERFGELRALGYPILFASSRKSFIGRIFGRPARELLVPSLATAALGISAGARLLRVHDVAETVQLSRMFAAVAPEMRAAISIADRMPETPGNLPDRPAV